MPRIGHQRSPAVGLLVLEQRAADEADRHAELVGLPAELRDDYRLARQSTIRAATRITTGR